MPAGKVYEKGTHNNAFVHKQRQGKQIILIICFSYELVLCFSFIILRGAYHSFLPQCSFFGGVLNINSLEAGSNDLQSCLQTQLKNNFLV